ncbi:hypothetical protein MWU49_09245 [Alcanivorax sp. S6407]|uniref:hypothetical protein n=1 Tax=Alcanivorax sp. S6407 TaxID=2926424 RepID=UPI001FF2EBD9|nr:hypothetical protein [Alcanivorax sp. S6407]MCK0153888.1 hypothetical protein [Alcanivorax sp. S6407]
MEWCGWDWPCIWSNVFGSAAAAWVQVAATIAAFVWSINATRETFQKDQRLARRMMRHQTALHKRAWKEDIDRLIFERQEAYSKGLVRGKVLILRLLGSANNIAEYIEANMPDDPGMYRVALEDTLGTVREDLAAMREVMLGDLPNPATISLMNFGVVMAEDLKSLLVHSLSCTPLLADRDEAVYIGKRLDKLHGHLQNYHEKQFAHDRNAEPEKFEDIERAAHFHAAP